MRAPRQRLGVGRAYVLVRQPQVFFTSDEQGKPAIYRVHVEHSSKRPASAAPIFSPDSRQVFFTSDKQAKPAILGEHRARDLASAAPFFSPDRRQVFFTSDKQGKPAIYHVHVERFHRTNRAGKLSCQFKPARADPMRAQSTRPGIGRAHFLA